MQTPEEKRQRPAVQGIAFEEEDWLYIDAMRNCFPRADGKEAGVTEVVRRIIREHRDKVGLPQREG